MPEGLIVDSVTNDGITLKRSCGGIFDNSNFNDISSNRGFVKITL